MKMAPTGYQLHTICAVFMIFLCTTTFAMEYSAYCNKLCMWGRGGNLCKCNAVHFAGKRFYKALAGHSTKDGVVGEDKDKRMQSEGSEEIGHGKPFDFRNMGAIDDYLMPSHADTQSVRGKTIGRMMAQDNVQASDVEDIVRRLVSILKTDLKADSSPEGDYKDGE